MSAAAISVLAGPVLERPAPIAVGTVFVWAGRPLKVASVHGEDSSAPVIVEELADGFGWLEGQYALWSLGGVMGALYSGPGAP
ncbi:hypothetical protein [Microbaculum marinisediminis]|uniref:Uncharacterized protein n=1 Tax=Microbaculum marinisediminis TaxID=2931392 RepID=A0AAW5QUG8_9HYPH|nr:hypothetical protein [Microbaculum sp. A6E488]MCT8970602.1 hypothetical protein [Microbaculum sp. A6E488]